MFKDIAQWNMLKKKTKVEQHQKSQSNIVESIKKYNFIKWFLFRYNFNLSISFGGIAKKV